MYVCRVPGEYRTPIGRKTNPFDMETAEQLLEKLNRQFNAGEPAAIILRTLTALEAAIRRSPPIPRPPFEQQPSAAEIPVHYQQIDVKADAAEESDELPIVQVLEVDEAEIEEELRALREAAELRQTRQQHLRPDISAFQDAEVYSLDEEILPQPQNEQREEPKKAAEPLHQTHVHSNTVVSTGTLGRELNDAIANQSSSLNDRFRTAVQGPNLPKFLSPITDLRAVIGINDRFRFVNDLFSGDGNLFVQAVNYLNHCAGYDDAVGWLQNQLRSSGNWNPENPTLKDFLHLLERRYS